MVPAFHNQLYLSNVLTCTARKMEAVMAKQMTPRMSKRVMRESTAAARTTTSCLSLRTNSCKGTTMRTQIRIKNLESFANKLYSTTHVSPSIQNTSNCFNQAQKKFSEEWVKPTLAIPLMGGGRKAEERRARKLEAVSLTDFTAPDTARYARVCHAVKERVTEFHNTVTV